MACSSFISAECVRQPGETDTHEPLGGLVLLGESVAARRLRSQIRRIAPYFRTALVLGEVGTGKELVAQCLHAGSPGAEGSFLAAEAAVFAEAFAHGTEPHAAGMRVVRPLLESARGGTLYLKGVGELTFGLQAGLLRFLRACAERRGGAPGIGGVRFQRADARSSVIRVLAASDRDLRMLTATGQFQQELYARLSAVEIAVPPLRERLEDIPALGEWVLRRLAEQMRQNPRRLADATVSLLQTARWPGNLRQLERVVCQAAALAEGALIEPRHLLTVAAAGFVEPATASAAKPERLHDVIQQHVFEVLERCGGNKLRAAERLGISRSTLYRMLEGKGAAGAS